VKESTVSIRHRVITDLKFWECELYNCTYIMYYFVFNAGEHIRKSLAADKDEHNLISRVSEDLRLEAEAVKQLRRKHDILKAEYRKIEHKLKSECDASEMNKETVLIGKAEEKLKWKQDVLDTLIEAKNNLIKELDILKKDIEHIIALYVENEKKLKWNQELDSLKAEHNNTVKKLIKERDDAKAELRAIEELLDPSVQLVHKDAQLQSAIQSSTELERLGKELMSESIRRVAAEATVKRLTKKTVELQRKHERDKRLFSGHFCGAGKSASLLLDNIN